MEAAINAAIIEYCRDHHYDKTKNALLTETQNIDTNEECPLHTLERKFSIVAKLQTSLHLAERERRLLRRQFDALCKTTYDLPTGDEQHFTFDLSRRIIDPELVSLYQVSHVLPIYVKVVSGKTVKCQKLEGSCVWTLVSSSPVTSICISPEGCSLALGFEEGRIEYYADILTVEKTSAMVPETDAKSCKGIRLTDARMIYLTDDNDFVVCSLLKGSVLKTIPTLARVSAWDIDAETGTIISGCEDGKLLCWDWTAGGPAVFELADHHKRKVEIVKSLGPKIVATCDREGKPSIWVIDEGQRLQLRTSLEYHFNWVVSVSTSTRGVLTASDDGRIALWNSESYEKIDEAKIGPCTQVQSGYGATWLVALASGRLTLYPRKKRSRLTSSISARSTRANSLADENKQLTNAPLNRSASKKVDDLGGAVSSRTSSHSYSRRAELHSAKQAQPFARLASTGGVATGIKDSEQILTSDTTDGSGMLSSIRAVTSKRVREPVQAITAHSKDRHDSSRAHPADRMRAKKSAETDCTIPTKKSAETPSAAALTPLANSLNGSSAHEPALLGTYSLYDDGARVGTPCRAPALGRSPDNQEFQSIPCTDMCSPALEHRLSPRDAIVTLEEMGLAALNRAASERTTTIKRHESDSRTPGAMLGHQPELLTGVTQKRAPASSASSRASVGPSMQVVGRTSSEVGIVGEAPNSAGRTIPSQPASSRSHGRGCINSARATRNTVDAARLAATSAMISPGSPAASESASRSSNPAGTRMNITQRLEMEVRAAQAQLLSEGKQTHRSTLGSAKVDSLRKPKSRLPVVGESATSQAPPATSQALHDISNRRRGAPSQGNDYARRSQPDSADSQPQAVDSISTPRAAPSKLGSNLPSTARNNANLLSVDPSVNRLLQTSRRPDRV